MIIITTDDKQFEQMRTDLANVATNLTKELRVVSWNVAKKTRAFMAKQIGQVLVAPQKIIKKQFTTKKVGETGALVVLKSSPAISVKWMKPRHTKAGVSWQETKNGGRTNEPMGFMGGKPGTKAPRLHGHAFKRVSADSRADITKLVGMSPLEAYLKNAMATVTREQIEKDLAYELTRRVRFLDLKKQGKI